MGAPETRTIATNRRARHEYAIEETFEAGLELIGSEVKAIRAGLVSIAEAYCAVRDGEVFLIGATITANTTAPWQTHAPGRERRLLLHRREIDRIRTRVDERGFTLIPLRLYFRGGRAKLEIALARGKNFVDKRDSIAEREARREMERVVKRGDRE